MWTKVLWVRQGFPDNYVPATFLGQLRRNRDVKKYEYWPVVQDTCVIALNISLVLIFLATFVGIYEGKVDPAYANGTALIHTLVLCVFWANSDHNKSVFYTIKSACLLTMVVRALSPVFLSLTRSTSSDSIWHLGAWLCLLYILSASLPMEKRRHTRVMATNTALTATIVLSSRLATAEHVFHFLMFSMQTFVLLPSAGLWIRRTSPAIYFVFVSNAAITACLLTFSYLGAWICAVSALTQLGIIFGIPKWFLVSQKYKDQISGPWDPAKAVIDVEYES